MESKLNTFIKNNIPSLLVNVKNYIYNVFRIKKCDEKYFWDLIQLFMSSHKIRAYFEALLFFIPKEDNILSHRYLELIRSSNAIIYIFKTFVYKLPKLKENIPLDELLSEFLKEQLFTILLYSFCNYIEKDFKTLTNITFLNPFCEIHELFIYENTIGSKINKIYMSFANYLELYKYDKTETIYIFLQIIHNLFLLQNLIEFVHFDLHSDNIMIKPNPLKSNQMVLFNNLIIPKPKYVPVFIDLGMSCGKIFNIKIKPYAIFKTEVCPNIPFYDLRLLLADICGFWIENPLVMNTIVLKSIKKLFRFYKLPSDPKKIQKFFYENKKHPENYQFYPKTLINIFEKML